VGGEPRALSAPAPPEELTALLAPEVEGAALNSAPSKSSAATPCCWGPCTCPAGGVAADAPSPTVDDEAGPLLPPPPAPNKSSVLSTRLGTIGAPLMTSRAPPKPSRSSILPKETLPGRLLFFIGEEEKGFTGEEYIAGEEKKSLAGGAPGVAMGIAPEVGRMGLKGRGKDERGSEDSLFTTGSQDNPPTRVCVCGRQGKKVIGREGGGLTLSRH